MASNQLDRSTEQTAGIGKRLRELAEVRDNERRAMERRFLERRAIPRRVEDQQLATTGLFWVWFMLPTRIFQEWVRLLERSFKSQLWR